MAENVQVDAESLIELIQRDDKDRLILRSKELLEESIEEEYQDKENRDPIPNQQLNRSIISRLLQLTCKINSVKCAKALIEGQAGVVPNVNERDRNGRTALHIAAETHSTRCIELLIQKHARTDIKASDGNFALETALSSKRLLSLWNPEETVEDLLVRLSETDLSSVILLVEKTSGIAEVAYVNAMKGRVISLATLLMVVPEKVTVPIMVVRPDGMMGSKETTTIYECIIGEALSLGQKGASSSSSSSSKGGAKQISSNNNNRDSSDYSEKRKLLLCEIELLQLFGATPTTVTQKDSKEPKVTSPFIRASQAGDETIMKLLLKTNVQINETDAEGNSALHWCLRSTSDINKQARLISLLLKHGAIVSQRNILGVTPLHVAAASGYVVALQILLLRDSDCVNAVSEMKETPLFLAVKNEFKDCVQLLLRYGANTKILNLRKQRPIDIAKSQDMRFLLNPANIRFACVGDPNPVPDRESAFKWLNRNLQLTDTDEEMSEDSLHPKEDITTADERVFLGAKTEVCKYFESPGGCVRGAKCYFAHGKEELLDRSSNKHRSFKACSPVSDQDNRKIFVGGLPPSVDSETLEEFFEKTFGAVDEASVIAGQTREHPVHSRGFGFVTFKNEESVAAAVQAHYVAIWGKKVEIKGAVPKHTLSGETMSTISAPPSSSEQQKQMPEPIINENKTTNDVRKLESTSSWVDKLLHGKPRSSPSTGTQAGKTSTATSSVKQNVPSWLTTFKKWLPRFLVEVSKRLKKGEWYALSSLKGDFRAICHQELDHASLGYAKLSDFMGSLSGICRMKIVPVRGHGAATHMVLLPNLQKQQLHHFHQIKQKQKQQQQQPSTSFNRPLVLVNEDEDEDDDDDGDSHLVDSPHSTGNGNFGFVGSVEEGGEGQEERPSGQQGMNDINSEERPSGQQGMNDTNSDVASRFLQFLKWDPIFQDRQWMKNRENADDEIKKQQKHLVLQAFSRKKKPFSFFAREFDFHENYRRSLDKERCFGCNVKNEENIPKTRCSSSKMTVQDDDNTTVPKMLWINKPCKHMLWCSKCKMWAGRQAPEQERECVICDAKIDRCEFQAWVPHLHEAQKSNETEFPPLGAEHSPVAPSPSKVGRCIFQPWDQLHEALKPDNTEFPLLCAERSRSSIF